MATKAVGQITVFDYSDGYSVMLTNPSYTFIGDEDSVRGVQSVTTRVVAMQGASQINASVDTSQIIKPTGFTVTSNGATPSPTLTIQANQSVTDAGVLTIPVTVATGVTVSLQWSYSIAFTGGKGDTGDAGRGVTGTTVQYASGTLPTTPPSSGWQDTVPSVDEGEYLWVKTVFTYSSGDPVTTYSVAKQGEKGSTGNGISSTVVEYAESTSGTTPPATIASWGTDIPNVAQGNYLWTRTTTNYTGSNPTVSYSVARIGMDGEPATAYSLIVSHAAITKSASGTFSPTSITLTAKSQTGTGAFTNYSGRFKIEVHNGSSWSTKYTSSSNENTKSYTIPSGTTQVRCSLYLAGGTTTLLDQQTIPVVSDGSDGKDAYAIILDNESHTFAGGTSAAIAGTATVNVYTYKGATAIAPTVTKANISGLPTGMSVQSVTNDSTNKKSTIVFAVTTSMVTRSGMVTIPVVADSKTFNKEFSYSLALQGTKGDTGDKGDKGDKGDTGKSLTGITEYYARNNSTTAPADSAFNTSVLTPTASEKYVWNYEQLSWNDNGTTSTTKTTKHIIAVYGDKGETGDKGNTGKSLTNVTEYYAVNNSTTAPADNSFSPTVAAPTSSNKYLWNYELLTWDDNGTASTTKTDKHIAAVYGDKGDKGDTGKALTGITEYYALNNSTTAPADSSFSTTVKTPTASNKYVWNYEQLSWNDNGTTSTTKTTKHIVAVYGDKGDQGDKGNTGKALTGITEYYAINNSTTAPADSAFGTSVKAPTSSNKYLWNYELLAWNDNGTTSTTKTDKHIAAIYGDKGDKGDTGVSISSVTNYYLATSASSGVTTSTSGWTTTVQTMDSTKQYLWNYEVIKGSDNSTLNTTIPVIIGRYGQNGGKGDKGDTGKGITSIAEHYQVSSSNTTAPSSWSDTMVNTTATNKYLWNYETITYTDGTTEDSTKRVIGTHGDKGDTGASIASVTNYYLASASSSGVTTSTSGWTTNPTASAATMTSTKQYLWNYEVIKDSNNTTITTTSPVIIGRYGQNGGTGSAGKGITGITEYYLATSASSGVTTSTSGWTTAVQSTTATNKYLWNYEVISYTSGNPYTSDPRIIGTYGDKGNKGDKGDKGDKGNTGKALTGITEYYAINNSTTAPADSAFGTSVKAPTSSNKYLWNYELLAWNDNGTTSTTKTDKHIAAIYGDKGDKGDTGVSISSVTNYYLATSASSGVTTSTSGWTTTVQTMDSTKQYLWNYEVIKGSDNSTLNTTIPVIIGRYGQNGGKGDKGDTGKGITSIAEHYQVSSSNTTAPSSWSDTMVNTTATNKYLWNYETITYTDGTTEDSTKRVIGTHGDKGDTGASIASVTNYYLASASSSGVTTSTSGWTTNPTASAATMTSTKQYLWNYEVIKDSNNTTITTTSPVIIGRYGQNGGTGSAGKGITGIAEYYLATSASSGVTASTSGWTTAVQSADATNKYLWNYEVISYTSGDPYTSNPRIIGTYGDKGDKGDTGDRGATWYAGTGITGTSTTAKVFSGSGVSSAIVGDHYLNTSTQNVYRCTVAGAASTAKWVYEQNIKGEQGIQGIQGIQGNKGDPGDTYYFHIKYSNDGGATFTGNSGEDTGSYIGTYADTVEADSVDVGDYDWVKIEGSDGRNGADHNLLMDVYASSLTKVDGPANRYLSESGNSTTTGEFIAEANLPDPNATHFYRISATQAGKNRGLGWYVNGHPPIISGSTYRIGCFARACSGSPKMCLRFSSNSANKKFFTVSNVDWQWFEYTAIFEDSGSTDNVYKRTYFYCYPQAAGDALDMCGFRLERVADDVLAIKLTADTAKADAATAQATADAAQTAANNAQATANQKKQTFISTPTPPYYEGDAYFKTESGESGSAQWYVCTNTRLTAYGTGESWVDDFEPTSYALEATLQNTKAELLEEDKKIKASVEEQKKYTDGKVTPLETRTSTLEQAARDLTLTFNTEVSDLKERTENNENDLSSYQKVFAFTENGLQISEQRDKIQTPSVLQIDNGKISFIVDGQEASYWSGENSLFYVGDIVVGLNKKAQFGNFAWIPRSNGNLSFRWVGSAEDNN